MAGWLRRRAPARALGRVLIIGPGNYPLLLPGVQLLQALVAGNTVVVKPGHGGRPVQVVLADLLRRAGLPDGLLTVLDESPRAATEMIDAGVDKVVLTGSLETGRAVLERLAATATPAVMELSGCEPVFVRADADLDLVAQGLRFGVQFNGGYTCIAPRRVFVDRRLAEELEARLAAELAQAGPARVGGQVTLEVRDLGAQALSDGARIAFGELPAGSSMRPLVLADVEPSMAVFAADLAAPILSLCPVDDDQDALAKCQQSPYRLGATVFGDGPGARRLAERIPAGVVVVNDLIVPTADPRVPFGGRRDSGFGVTRGAEGLLELTQVKAVIRRRGRFRPHFDPPSAAQESVLSAFLRLGHSRDLGGRLRALSDLIRALMTSKARR